MVASIIWLVILLVVLGCVYGLGYFFLTRVLNQPGAVRVYNIIWCVVVILLLLFELLRIVQGRPVVFW